MIEKICYTLLIVLFVFDIASSDILPTDKRLVITVPCTVFLFAVLGFLHFKEARKARKETESEILTIKTLLNKDTEEEEL